MLGVVQRHGVLPELRWAPSVQGRWQVTRTLLAQISQGRTLRSLLDVGGIGTYEGNVLQYECVNVASEVRASNCNLYDGDRLPYADGAFEVALAESTLHHAAENASSLLSEMARTSARYVIVGEDILEPGASEDVAREFRLHDPHAVYRSLDGWVATGSSFGLKLFRILVLNRVPVHASNLVVCSFGYAPMAYIVWQKTG